MSDHNPRPPAAAYHVVANHLTDIYFTTPPPPDGVVLTVTSRADNVPTQWYFGESAADHMAARLRANPSVTISARRYHRSDRP